MRLLIAGTLKGQLTAATNAAAGLPFPDDFFDLVYSQVAWLYFGNKIGVMREVMRVLRDGGLAKIDADELRPGLPAEYARLVEIWQDGALCRSVNTCARYAIGARRSAPEGHYLRFGKVAVVRRRPRAGARDRPQHAPRALGRHQVRVSRAARHRRRRASACSRRSRNVMRLPASNSRNSAWPASSPACACARSAAYAALRLRRKQLVEIVERRRRPRARIAIVMPQQHLQRRFDARLPVAQVERHVQRVRRQRCHAVRRVVAQVEHVARTHDDLRFDADPSARVRDRPASRGAAAGADGCSSASRPPCG